ncbi:uncharacterized protein LOC108735094 [Agrilus planipennis]|uniref:Uncharacterized protein LOC108735094 n=1 Tax=Agrilus planipennis TaxID=224129 RepID=A0A7F5RGA7_AGRPL|nr:uncharacterized protein LOC108735094 [Agrilus planipennis]
MELLIVVVLHFLTSAGGLKLTNMTIPLVADTRSPMELHCRFDMENEELYAVKWYKDDHEFFRYMPHQQPHKQTFHVPGVHLLSDEWDCSFSHCRLVLSGLSRPHSSGAYRCEISTEAPTFRLASETRNVTVATLPESGPRIEGLQESYIEGETVTANCSSYPSDPAPILTWRINNVEASLFTRNNAASEPDQDGLTSRSALLVFQAERKHSQEGDTIELRCETALPGVPLPPRAAVRRISIKSVHQHQQTVNNQQLLWHNSSAYLPGTLPRLFAVIYFSLVIKWLH